MNNLVMVFMASWCLEVCSIDKPPPTGRIGTQSPQNPVFRVTWVNSGDLVKMVKNTVFEPKEVKIVIFRGFES